MAAPGTALAGQPGRRVGYRHPAADQRNRPQAADRQGAGRPVRVCLQPPAPVPRPGPVTVSALAWLERASLPVGQLSDPRVIRAALDRLCVRLDGSLAAANTITRKRTVFHGALGYAQQAITHLKRLLEAMQPGIAGQAQPHLGALEVMINQRADHPFRPHPRAGTDETDTAARRFD